ncbi:hypothetical protein [Saccharothrix variisporea]|uniref:DUF5709 domain-containing protein n=1 Tax=Saccharothrix variisporea TaxID=543527 RepID=A0A495X2Y5_9PSEU|nr:hypothetical protein [Saccharothrix variisporea]RKT67544.1 hypothetical protein DFJ66_0719 [Saccharothrix variisporea]
MGVENEVFRQADAVDLPEGDAVDQRTPVDPDAETDELEPLGDAWHHADPADVADQQRVVPLDDEPDPV